METITLPVDPAHGIVEPATTMPEVNTMGSTRAVREGTFEQEEATVPKDIVVPHIKSASAKPTIPSENGSKPSENESNPRLANETKTLNHETDSGITDVGNDKELPNKPLSSISDNAIPEDKTETNVTNAETTEDVKCVDNIDGNSLNPTAGTDKQPNAGQSTNNDSVNPEIVNTNAEIIHSNGDTPTDNAANGNVKGNSNNDSNEKQPLLSPDQAGIAKVTQLVDSNKEQDHAAASDIDIDSTNDATFGALIQKIKELKQENAALRGENLGLRTENTTFRDTNNTLRNDLDASRKQTYDVKEEFVKQQSENIKITKQIMDIEREFQDRKMRNIAEETEKMSSFEETKAQRNRLSDEVYEQTREIGELKMENSRLQHEVEQRLQKINELSTDNVRMIAEDERHQHGSSELAVTVDKLNKQVVILNRKLSDKETEMTDMTAKLEREKAELKMNCEREARQVKELSSWKYKYESLLREKDKIASMHNGQLADLNKASKEIHRQHAHICNLDTQMEALNTQIDNLVDTNETLLGSLESERGNCLLVQKRANELDNQKDRLCEKLYDLEMDMKSMKGIKKRFAEMEFNSKQLFEENKRLKYLVTEKKIQMTGYKSEHLEMKSSLEVLLEKQNYSEERVKQLECFIDGMARSPENVRTASGKRRMIDLASLGKDGGATRLPDINRKASGVSAGYGERRKHLQSIQRKKRW